MRLRRYGTVGVLVELDSGDEVDALCTAVEAAGLPLTARAGWRSVLITGDLALPELAAAIERLDLDDAVPLRAREAVVPVTFDGEDLDSVARLTGLQPGEVVDLFTAGNYVVRCLGFTRAFPYLEGLDPRLHISRHDTPRTRVPAGSVAIAGEQAGIYPRTSPGGWRLIGRTDFVVFEETLDPPARLRPGDRVRFVARSGS